MGTGLRFGGSLGRVISRDSDWLPLGQGSSCKVTRPLASVQRCTTMVCTGVADAVAGGAGVFDAEPAVDKKAKLRAIHVFMPGIVRLTGRYRQLPWAVIHWAFIVVRILFPRFLPEPVHR